MIVNITILCLTYGYIVAVFMTSCCMIFVD